MYTYTHMICMYTHNLYMIYILYMICCRDNLLASTWTRGPEEDDPNMGVSTNHNGDMLWDITNHNKRIYGSVQNANLMENMMTNHVFFGLDLDRSRYGHRYGLHVWGM